MSDQHDLLGTAKAFQNAANRHAIDEVMAMFADDAEFELVGLTRLAGKKEIRSIFEYDEGVNGRIELINCTLQGDMVTCQLVESNDRLRIAGFDRMHYPSCVLSFADGLIRAWRATPDPESTRSFNQFWGAVQAWIAEHHAADYACMVTPQGHFIRDRENGVRVVQLAREYRSSV